MISRATTFGGWRTAAARTAHRARTRAPVVDRAFPSELITNGAMNREACKLFNLYKRQARTTKVDRTEYVMSEGELSKRNNFATHWGQRLSAAVVEADAIRALACVDKEARDRRPATRAA